MRFEVRGWGIKVGLMVLVVGEVGIEGGIGENARVCMGVQVRGGKGFGTC